jgi:hypothetical protein
VPDYAERGSEGTGQRRLGWSGTRHNPGSFLGGFSVWVRQAWMASSRHPLEPHSRTEVGITNATAFSPTDVMPLSRGVKLTMLAQSLITVTLVIARAVNVLK